jgi:hypothetical protein
VTWGSASYIEGDGDVCSDCPHCADCRSIVKAGRHVRCEKPDPELDRLASMRQCSARPRDYRDVLTPGQPFTSTQLARLTGRTLHQASVWCRDRYHKGELVRIGIEVPTHAGNQRAIYQWTGFAPSRDGMIEHTPTANGKGTAGLVDRAASGRGEEDK